MQANLENNYCCFSHFFYFLAIETWMLACILFVLGAMMEYAGLLLKMKIESLRLPQKFELLNFEDDKQGFNDNNKVEKVEDKSYARLDIIFLILFPLLFLTFNVCYWSLY